MPFFTPTEASTMPSSVVGTLTKGTGLAKGALVVDGGGASLVSAQDAGRCRTMQDETGRDRTTQKAGIPNMDATYLLFCKSLRPNRQCRAARPPRWPGRVPSFLTCTHRGSAKGHREPPDFCFSPLRRAHRRSSQPRSGRSRILWHCRE